MIRVFIYLSETEYRKDQGFRRSGLFLSCFCTSQRSKLSTIPTLLLVMAAAGRASITGKLLGRELPRAITSPAPASTASSCAAAVAATATAATLSQTAADKHTLQQVFDVDDSRRLFASVPTGTLLRSLVNLYAMSLEPVVDAGIAVLRSRAVERSAAARAVVMAAVRETAYRQFCAGEGVEEAGRTLQGLWDEGLRGILDYSLEDADDNAGCDANLVQFLTTVELTSRLPPSSVSFACVKITAICPATLLERVSDLLRWEQKKSPSSTAALPWRRHSLPVLSDSSPLYHTPSAPPPLSPAEERDLELAHGRLYALCARCAEFGLPLLVDAEYTSVQPAIDYITFDAAVRFNRAISDDHPLVYGTVQAYLRDAKDRLVLAMEASDREGIAMGFKLVRGAYMTREARVAASLGAASPVHPTIRDTHACYNQCASFMLERAAEGSGSVVLATHNLDSGRMAAAKAEELGMSRGDRRVQFAQLKGMAEGLSLGLRDAGFNVSKYLPFGPVDKVMPYLVRRAEENRGLLSSSSLDLQLMRRELKRRLERGLLG